VIPTKVEVLPGKHWLKITPTQQLTIGEYAVVEILSASDINQSVWDFRVDPQLATIPRRWDRYTSRLGERHHADVQPLTPRKTPRLLLQGRSVTDVARHLGVTRPALSRVLNGKAGVSADMALRISEAFNTDPDFWLRLQEQRDLWVASQKKRATVKPLTETAAA